MRYLRRSAFLRLVVLPFTLTLWLGACTSYKTLSPPYGESLIREQADLVRVTLRDESPWEIAEPSIANDSLVGLDHTSWDRDQRVYTRQARVALSDVSSMEVKKTDISTAAIVGGLFGVLIVAWLIECSGAEGFEAIGCP